MSTREQIIEMLETILDPEVGVDIWTMGLIYDIQIQDEKKLYLKMTYTTPMCPAGPAMQEEIMSDMRALGFEHIEIDLTFDPPWQPSRELKEALGLAT
mgnify:CR=1 FL=1